MTFLRVTKTHCKDELRLVTLGVMWALFLAFAVNTGPSKADIYNSSANRIVDDFIDHEHIMLPCRFAGWKTELQFSEVEGRLLPLFKEACLYASLKDQSELEEKAQASLGEVIAPAYNPTSGHALSSEYAHRALIISPLHDITGSELNLIALLKQTVPGRADAYYEIESTERPKLEKQILESLQTLRLRYIVLGVAAVLALFAFGVLAYQRHMIKALQFSRRQADRASAAKSSFLANISHELRTPLNAILGFSEMIKDEILGPVGHPEYKRHVSEIYIAGRQLQTLINDTLNISRAESGLMVLDKEQWDSHILACEAVDQVNYWNKGQKAQISIDIASDIPSIQVDGRLIRQALVALLTNALKYTPIEGHISLACSVNPDGTISFIVTDTGEGMTEAEIDKALSPFGQILNEAHPVGEGNGLGLNLVKSYVESHDGKFDVVSQKDVGTVARITLPKASVLHGQARTVNDVGT